MDSRAIDDRTGLGADWRVRDDTVYIVILLTSTQASDVGNADTAACLAGTYPPGDGVNYASACWNGGDGFVDGRANAIGVRA